MTYALRTYWEDLTPTNLETIDKILAAFLKRTLSVHKSASSWEISWQQAYRILKRRVNRLITIVRRNFWGILTFLQALDRDFQRFARKSKRRKDPSTFDRLKLVRA